MSRFVSRSRQTAAPTRGWPRGLHATRSRPRSQRAISFVALLQGSALLLGCLGCDGEPPPEQRLAQTREQLAEVSREVGTLEAKVERRREAVREAEDALARARDELEESEQELARVRSRLDEHATRVAVFRAVQKALLEREALEDYAIRVEVADGRVTLRGEVDEQKQADAALEVARNAIGADDSGDEPMRVESALRIRSKASKATKQSEAGKAKSGGSASAQQSASKSDDASS